MAHEDAGPWSGSKGEGKCVAEEVDAGAGRVERSAFKSNGDCAKGGIGDALGLAEKKRVASSPKLEGTVCAVRNICPRRMRN